MVISGLPKTGKNEQLGFFSFSVSGLPVFRRPPKNVPQIFFPTGVRSSGLLKTPKNTLRIFSQLVFGFPVFREPLKNAFGHFWLLLVASGRLRAPSTTSLAGGWSASARQPPLTRSSPTTGPSCRTPSRPIIRKNIKKRVRFLADVLCN